MWQDWYFALTGALFGALLIPSCLNRKTEVPRTSSVPTAALLAINAGVWTTMDMTLAAGLSVITAAVWTFLAVARPIRSTVGENARGELTTLMAITERESQVVEQYREWLALQEKKTRDQMIRNTLLNEDDAGGCGGCPSRGSCGS